MARVVGYKASEETKAKIKATRASTKERNIAVGKAVIARLGIDLEALTAEEVAGLAEVFTAEKKIKPVKKASKAKEDKALKVKIAEAVKNVVKEGDAILFKIAEKTLQATFKGKTKTGRLQLESAEGFKKTIVPQAALKINNIPVLSLLVA